MTSATPLDYSKNLIHHSNVLQPLVYSASHIVWRMKRIFSMGSIDVMDFRLKERKIRALNIIDIDNNLIIIA
jgi:hypothetical protein